MPFDPDELDELEEIKRLISGDSSAFTLDPLPPGLDSLPPGLEPLPHGLDSLPHDPEPLPHGLSSLPPGLDPLPHGLGHGEPGIPGTDRKPESGGQVSGVPAVRRSTAAPQPEQVSGVPAVRQKPGTPQPKQTPGAPAVYEKPGTPQPGQTPGTPAVKQKSPAPALRKRPSLPGLREDEKQVRSYDISSTGKVTEHTGADPDTDIGAAKFKVNFDFDEAYKDVPENRPLRFRRERRTGCLGGILYAAFVICISIVLAALMWIAAVDVLGFGEDNVQVNVTVLPGFTMEDITDMLYDAELIRYKFLFNFYANFSNAEDKITPGAYVLNKNHDYRALVQGMTARAGVRVETSVTVPEGYTLAQIFTLMEDYEVCSAADLWEAATNHDFNYHFLDKDTLGDRLRLEGFLFPDTHNFYVGSDPVQVLNRFLRDFDKRLTETYIERINDMGFSVRDIINIASMIEREAGSDEERPRIAAVIYNRLKSNDFPHLQIDATIFYAIAGTGIPFSTDYDHPYNTYLNEGLPPGPIANPGMASIRAALYPDTTNEYYYALNRSGTHNFFRTRAQHQAFVQGPEYGGN